MNSLSNKHILITGATGYLGNQLAFGLAELGANIHVNSRTRDACERLVHDIKASGLSAVLASFDVVNKERRADHPLSSNQSLRAGRNSLRLSRSSDKFSRIPVSSKYKYANSV